MIQFDFAQRTQSSGPLPLGVANTPDSSRVDPEIIREQNPFIGVVAVLTVVTLSGFAGIFFEKILKTRTEYTQLTIWDRNVQMAFVTILLIFLKLTFIDSFDLLQKGFFHGYSYVTFIQILLNAAGGMLVALAVSYADTIIKVLFTFFVSFAPHHTRGRVKSLQVFA